MKSSFKKSDIIKYMIIALVAYLSKQVMDHLLDSVVDKKTEQIANEQKQEEQEEAKTQVISGTIQGHDYVDLGLSVKWATCNVGAENPWDYGDYFAWGETETKNSYIEENSSTYGVSFSDLENYRLIDEYGNLTFDYDAASKNWGEGWRMPNSKECDELVNECRWTWSIFNGVNGYKVTGKNGNWIFLPAAAGSSDTSSYLVGSIGYYWSSAVYESLSIYGLSIYACRLYFDSDRRSTDYDCRNNGRTVRPVTE